MSLPKPKFDHSRYKPRQYKDTSMPLLDALELPEPQHQLVSLPEPLNKYTRFGIKIKPMLQWAENIENISALITINQGLEKFLNYQYLPNLLGYLSPIHVIRFLYLAGRKDTRILSRANYFREEQKQLDAQHPKTLPDSERLFAQSPESTQHSPTIYFVKIMRPPLEETKLYVRKTGESLADFIERLIKVPDTLKITEPSSLGPWGFHEFILPAGIDDEGIRLEDTIERIARLPKLVQEGFFSYFEKPYYSFQAKVSLGTKFQTRRENLIRVTTNDSRKLIIRTLRWLGARQYQPSL